MMFFVKAGRKGSAAENGGNEKAKGSVSGISKRTNEAVYPGNIKRNQERIGTKYGIYRI